MIIYYIITVYTRAAEGEAAPAATDAGRVDVRRMEGEIVCSSGVG